MSIKVRTSAGCVARVSRKSTENLSLILLCATDLWRDVAVLDKRTGSVKAEGEFLHKVEFVSRGVNESDVTIAEGEVA
jgi:hypothetical protein